MLFNEPKLLKSFRHLALSSEIKSFSALQRAEIAEICNRAGGANLERPVSVLFNEPKLLKFNVYGTGVGGGRESFSALQRAEIAEIAADCPSFDTAIRFQCSSTSRNC